MKRRKRKRMSSGETCYMCDSEAASYEHAPPWSFFPETHNTNLIVVPSCHKHNNDNSKDVEYVRNLVCSDINANEVGEAMFAKAQRSYENSPKLFRQTFAKVKRVYVQDKKTGLYRETGIYQINLNRYNRVMRAITFALYFHDFGEKWPHYWWIYNATMISERQGFMDLPDNHNPHLRTAFRKVPVANKDTKQPEVFRYGVYRGKGHEAIYRLQFYGGVDVYALGVIQNKEDALQANLNRKIILPNLKGL